VPRDKLVESLPLDRRANGDSSSCRAAISGADALKEGHSSVFVLDNPGNENSVR
jgi:hypothetical protein